MNDVKFQKILNQLNQNEIIELNLRDKNLSTDQIVSLADALKVNTSLAELHVRNNQIGDLGAERFAAALKVNTTLKALYLSSNQITDSGAKNLANALQTNTTLQELYLSNNQISDIGAENFANIIRVNPTFKALFLSNNQITDIGAEKIAAVLKTNTTLKELALDANRFSDVAAEKIADALKMNNTLEELYLFKCHFENAGSKKLADALTANTKLTTVEICVGNHLDDFVFKKICDQLQFNIKIKSILKANQFINIKVHNDLLKIIQQKQSSLPTPNEQTSIKDVPSLKEIALSHVSNLMVEKKVTIKKARMSLPQDLFKPLIVTFFATQNRQSFSRLTLFNPIQTHLTTGKVDDQNSGNKLAYKICHK